MFISLLFSLLIVISTKNNIKLDRNIGLFATIDNVTKNASIYSIHENHSLLIKKHLLKNTY